MPTPVSGTKLENACVEKPRALTVCAGSLLFAVLGFHFISVPVVHSIYHARRFGGQNFVPIRCFFWPQAIGVQTLGGRSRNTVWTRWYGRAGLYFLQWYSDIYGKNCCIKITPGSTLDSMFFDPEEHLQHDKPQRSPFQNTCHLCTHRCGWCQSVTATVSTLALAPRASLTASKKHLKMQPWHEAPSLQPPPTASKDPTMAPNISKTASTQRFNCGKHLATKTGPKTAPTQHTD